MSPQERHTWEAIAMSAQNTPAVRVRIPFFWWRREVAATKAQDAGYLRCDTTYIPSGTADLWRSSRNRAA
jgi:hypothetical protein